MLGCLDHLTAGIGALLGVGLWKNCLGEVREVRDLKIQIAELCVEGWRSS